MRSQSRSTLGVQDPPVGAGNAVGLAPMKRIFSSPQRRRTTRSSSRGLDHVGSTGASTDVVRRRWGHNNNNGRMSLGAVVEESPAKSAQGSVHRNQVVVEPPEDAANISGTTISPSEPDTDLDPEMMIEALPDLERAAKNILDYLVPSSADPVSIVNTAKKLADPKNTQSKRLQRAVSNLKNEAKYFGHQTYVDVKLVNRLLTPALEKIETTKSWSPDPILHQANCARFALEVLLANAGTNSPKQAIKNAEDLFPLQFMNGLADNKEQKGVGESSLNKDTFDLALEMRTQSLILELERRQYEPGFYPSAIVANHFFEADSYDEDKFNSREAPLRGFNLATLGGAKGHDLPEQFRDAICDRYNEIRVLLLEMGDDVFDVDELKRAYRWQRFVLRAAQWVRKRIQEIASEQQGQQSAENVHKEFFPKPAPLERATSSPRPSATPVSGSRALSTAGPRIEQRDFAAPVADQRVTTMTIDDYERRKSKPAFLNSASIRRVMQRQLRLRSSRDASEARRQSDFATLAVNRESASSAPDLRRLTLPAVFQPSRVAQAERDEISSSEGSPEGSPTLLPDDHDYLPVDDSQFNISDHVGNGLERSHSPPVNRTSREPTTFSRAHTPNQATAVNSTRDMLRAIDETRTPRQPVRGTSLDRRPAFIDRQDNAERVSPISQEASILSTARRRVPPQPSRKRAREESEDEETISDDDFSSYGRALDLNRRREEKAELQRKKRQRVDEDADESASQLQQGLEESVLGEEVQNQPNEARPQDTRSPAKTGDYGADGTLTPLQGKGRLRWTQAEDARLIRLIGEFGPKWAKIERQNEAQPPEDGEVRIEGRSQIQLKDRARNLKIAFFRDEQPLPKNFDHVTMSQRDYAMLKKKGIKVPDT